MKNKKDPKAPYEIGSVGVVVRPLTEGIYDKWRVEYTAPDGRQRRKFSTKADADQFARDQVKRITAGDTALVNASPSDMAAYGRALEIIKPTGKSIELVVSEHMEAVKLAGAVSVVEAVRDYARRHTFAAVSVEDAVDRFVAFKSTRTKETKTGKTGLSDEHLRNMKSRLACFKAAFKCNLQDLKKEELKTYLEKVPGKLRTQNNYESDLRALFAYAKEEEHWLSKDWDEDRFKFPKAPPGKAQPFTPEEMATILAYAEDHAPKWVTYLALRAFAGVRGAEVPRLTEDHFQPGVITADPKVTKTGFSRLIPILPVLKQWLKKYPVKDGQFDQGDGMFGAITPVKPGSTCARLSELVQAAGVPTRNNGLRDSYVSYRMGEIQDAWKVSNETGHGADQLKRSYMETRLPDGRAITEQLAKQWFSIVPGSCKIIRLKRA